MIRPLLVCVALCVAYGNSKPTETKGRIRHRQPLSRHTHDDTKNHDFDHEAFLGPEDAETFDHLPAVESKYRLGLIVDRMDVNKDGFVSQEELELWIRNIQISHIRENTDHHLKDYDKNNDSMVSWEEYRTGTYALDGDLTDMDNEMEDLKLMISRDERRFKMADINKDGIANKEEFTAFLYPEEFAHMMDIVVQEAMEEMDKDGDGLINEKEFIGDIQIPKENGEEPQWLVKEREQFSKSRDQNHDGKMDKEEMRAWIVPLEFDAVKDEAKHLLQEADTSQDGKLTKEEILDNYETFVGSHVMEYDEAPLHEEF